MKRYQKEAEEF